MVHSNPSTLRTCAARLLVLGLLLTPGPVRAQLGLGGVMSFNGAMGGDASTTHVNGINTPNPHFIIGDLYLFADALLAESITFSAAIAARSFGGASLPQADLAFASVTFWDLAGPSLSLEAGKILSPFGAYVRRQFPDQDPLIGEPLAYGYGVNVSRFSGLSKSSGSVYDSTGTVTTMYYKRYISGVRLFGELGGGRYAWDLALSSNPPASSVSAETNQVGSLGISGRFGFRPFIWLDTGVSWSLGDYLEESPINAADEELGRYKQLVTGVDLTVDYHYLRFNFEYLTSKWDSPYLEPSASPPTDKFQISNATLLAETRWDLAAVPGVYLAARYERMTFNSIWEDFVAWSGATVPWDDDTSRIQIGGGWKPTRGVLIKASHTLNRTVGAFDPDDDVSALQLVVVF